MILQNFLLAITDILHILIYTYIIVVVASALISWVQPDPYNPIVQLLYRLTQPVYNFIRRFIPTVYGGFDFAPIILLIFLQFIDRFLIRTIEGLVSGL